MKNISKRQKQVLLSILRSNLGIHGRKIMILKTHSILSIIFSKKDSQLLHKHLSMILTANNQTKKLESMSKKSTKSGKAHYFGTIKFEQYVPLTIASTFIGKSKQGLVKNYAHSHSH
jgi:hypothetical protein